MPTRSEFEQELLGALWKAKDEPGLVDCGMEGLAAAATALAEKRGLRFDPGSVKLPELRVVRAPVGAIEAGRFVAAEGRYLTLEEAEEVIRRAVVHEEALALADQPLRPHDAAAAIGRIQEIMAVLRGGSRPEEAEVREGLAAGMAAWADSFRPGLEAAEGLRAALAPEPEAQDPDARLLTILEQIERATLAAREVLEAIRAERRAAEAPLCYRWR